MTLSHASFVPIHITCHRRMEIKNGMIHRVKYWERIADKLSKADWSLGWVSAVDSERANAWVVDAHRDNGKRFATRSDEKLTAFLELERACGRTPGGLRRA